MIALTFLVFLIGSFESVRHAHSTAVRHVAMRIEMARLARNDPLTGLENRLGLRRAFARHETETDPLVAIHCLDLDGFKGINDRFGHAAGDAVLAEVARRLVAAVPADATVARMGGDEFVVLQRAVRRPEEAEDLAARIQGSCASRCGSTGAASASGVSLGYAVAGAHGAQLEDLLRRADEASYRVKRGGRRSVRRSRPPRRPACATSPEARSDRLALEVPLQFVGIQARHRDRRLRHGLGGFGWAAVPMAAARRERSKATTTTIEISAGIQK